MDETQHVVPKGSRPATSVAPVREVRAFLAGQKQCHARNLPRLSGAAGK